MYAIQHTSFALDRAECTLKEGKAVFFVFFLGKKW
jgi:hypothetical protein